MFIFYIKSQKVEKKSYFLEKSGQRWLTMGKGSAIIDT